MQAVNLAALFSLRFQVKYPQRSAFMLIKILFVVLLLAIVWSLISGLRALVKGEQQDAKKLAKALTWRISLSLVLFLLLLGLHFTGVVPFHGLKPV